MNCLTIYLLSTIGHLLGDFVLQPTPVALKKAGLNKYMWTHVFIVAVTTMAPFLLLEVSPNFVWGFLIVLFSHLIIDNIKNFFTDRTDEAGFWTVLGFDQIVHVIFIYILLVYIFGC